MSKVARSVKRSDGWWIENMPGGIEDCGPYQTKAYAEEDRRGMLRTLNSKEWGQLHDHPKEET